MGRKATKFNKSTCCIFIWSCLMEKQDEYNTMQYYCDSLSLESQSCKRYISELRNSIVDIEELRNNFEDLIYDRATKSYRLIRRQ